MTKYWGGVLIAVLALASCQAACPSKFSASSNYRIKYNAPKYCEEAACDYLVNIATNEEDPKFLDFLIEGNALSWVAIGFSTEGSMTNADVLACALNPSNNNVEILDTHNVGYNNIRDTNQDVCPHFSNYSNGRISCSFSRAINTGDGQDKDLDAPYHLLYGASNKTNSARGGTLALSYHTITPIASADAYNPARDIMTATVKETHQGLMTTTTAVKSSALGNDLWPANETTSKPITSTSKPTSPTTDATTASSTISHTSEEQTAPTTASSTTTAPTTASSTTTTPTTASSTTTTPTTASSTTSHTSEEQTAPTTASSTTTAPTTASSTTTAPTTASSTTTTPTTASSTTSHTSEEQTAPTTASSTTSHTSEEQTAPTTASSTTTAPTTASSTTTAPTTASSTTTAPTTASSTTSHTSEEQTAPTTASSTTTAPTTASSTTSHTSEEQTAPTTASSTTTAPTTASSTTSHTSEEQTAPTTASSTTTAPTTASSTTSHTSEEQTAPTTANSTTSHASEGEHITTSSRMLSSPFVPTDMATTSNLPSTTSQTDVSPIVNNPTSHTNINMQQPQGCPSSISSDTNQHNFRKTFPPNCTQTTCDYYISIQTNKEKPDYLDFVMEAKAQGWVAIGFSSTPGMRDADVLACAMHPNTRSVIILDTYNSATKYDNAEDSIQNVCSYSASFINGRISCTFSRAINTGDVVQDKDLSKDYYQLYGAVDASPVVQGNLVRLSYHDNQDPVVSDDRINTLLEITSTSIESNGNELVTSSPSVPSTIPSTIYSTSKCPPKPPTNAKYRLQITIAPNCAEPGCGYYMMGIRTNDQNPSYLDFVLEGDAQGWVAIGFSPTRSMPDADVLACALNPSNSNVEILDTYNAGYSNIRDTNQDVCPHFSNYSNGRISCSFSRAINTGDGQDKDLNAPYHLLYGAVDAKPNMGKPNSLLQLKYHAGQLPIATTVRVNPTSHHETLNTSTSPLNSKHMLVLAHGILMLVAWPMLATVAIFFASWMKPALPKGAWFQVHRGVMAGSVVLAVCAFILIFIANKDSIYPGLISFSSGESTAHFAIGILVMVLHLVNPLISVARCAPDAPRRWIFNVIHGSLIGVGAYLLALINAAIGIFLLERDQHTILWVYLAYLSFLIVLLLALFVVFTIIAARSKDGSKLGPPLLKPLFNIRKPSLQSKSQSSSTAMVDIVSSSPPNPEAPAQPTKEKLASEDAPLRWTGLVLLLAVMIPMIAVIGIKIALKDQ